MNGISSAVENRCMTRNVPVVCVHHLRTSSFNIALYTAPFKVNHLPSTTSKPDGNHFMKNAQILSLKLLTRTNDAIKFITRVRRLFVVICIREDMIDGFRVNSEQPSSLHKQLIRNEFNKRVNDIHIE